TTGKWRRSRPARHKPALEGVRMELHSAGGVHGVDFLPTQRPRVGCSLPLRVRMQRRRNERDGIGRVSLEERKCDVVMVPWTIVESQQHGRTAWVPGSGQIVQKFLRPQRSVAVDSQKYQVSFELLGLNRVVAEYGHATAIIRWARGGHESRERLVPNAKELRRVLAPCSRDCIDHPIVLTRSVPLPSPGIPGVC